MKNKRTGQFHKFSRIIMSVVLSAALLAEPALGMSTVYAEETQEEYGENVVNSVSDNDSEEQDGAGESNDGPTSDKDGEQSDTGESDPATDDDADDESDGTISGNEIDETSPEETGDVIEDEETLEDNQDGFSDMPSDYRLTSFQRELKTDMTDTLRYFKEDEEGETFAENQVITFAESEEEAEMIADAYHAEVVDFDMGVLTLELGGGNTIKSALMAAADTDNNLPPVWPNYIREVYGEFAPETEEVQASGMQGEPDSGAEGVSTSELEITEEEYAIDDVDAGQTLEEEISAPETYEQALNELTGYNDPYLKSTASQYQWFHTTIGSAYAWGAGYTGNGVKVGVIDSGVDANTDLDANIFGKKDFCDGTTAVTDCQGHGTHVAGIIAAVANNSSGGAGVAPKAKIFNARVFGTTASKSGYDSTIIGAINYLIGEENNTKNEEISSNPTRVDIINMSLGGPGMSGAFQAVLDKAYQKGVIVFAATGNDGGTLQMYPASYNHVIAVAATDNNNERAYFSNYGALTDLAAPGVGIYSTNGSGYGSKQGTSMACPVAAGEAAVILSGKGALPSMKDAKGNDKTGKARVDAVESIMKGSTISAGSGMGKGITSLTKVFGLSTAAMKPKAPGITVLPNDTKQSVTVTIQAQDGMTICYTTNGKNPVYKNGAAGADTTKVNSNKASLTIDCSKSAKGTIKAIAVNASGVVSPVKSVSYTLRPYVSAITVSGPARIEQGKSIQLAAAVAPTYATNKSVTWEIQTSKGAAVDAAKIKIDQKGKITTAQNADIGTYKVIVRAKDDGKKSAQYSVEVVAAGSAIQSLAFEKNTPKELWCTKTTAAPTLSLSAYLIAKEKREGELTQIESGKLAGRVTWTSSKPAVAAVSNSGVVTAKAAGTTTITVKANDNSNKKVTVNITVKQAVTGITITSDKGMTSAGGYVVAAGKSMTFKATVNPAKPANKKVDWSIKPASGNKASSDDMKNITINKTSGKITVKSAAVPGNYIVTAEASDGKGAKASQTVKVCGGAIGEIKLNITKTTLYTQKVDAEKTNTGTITATIKGAGGTTDFDPNAYVVTSSNPSVAIVAVPSQTLSINSKDGTVPIKINITATGSMYGKANITIASTDGSNKKATCVVTVSGGIKKVQLQNSAGSKVSKLALFRKGTDTKSPKTAEIYAVIEGSAGANNKAYEVTSSNPSLVHVTTNKTTGTITLTAGDKITGKATITVMATDGSKKKATCTVTVNNPPSRINIAPKAGTAKYVVPGKSVQLVATLETEYGAVAGKSVTWSLPDSYKGSGITVNASGKVSVSKSYSTTGSVPVTATAKDGSGISATYSVTIVRPTTYIKTAGATTRGGVTRVNFSSDCSTPMSCSSSVPSVASPTISYSPSAGSGTITFVGMKRGTTVITIKALDSTNKTYKIRCRIK